MEKLTSKGKQSCCHCLVAKLCLILCDLMDCRMPDYPVLHYLSKFVQTPVHWVNDAIQPSYPLFPLLLLPSIFPSTRVFSNNLALSIRAKVLEFRLQYQSLQWGISLKISSPFPPNELISFRIDGFDLLDVQGTRKSLLQHHSLKTSVLRRSAFFMVQLSHPYMTTGKTIALII